MTSQTAVTRTGNERSPRQPEAALVPAVNVVEENGGITLFVDLPGVPRESLNLHVEADTLTIEGELSMAIPESMKSSHAEVSLPRYRRVFTLSKELDADKVTATFEHGVLTLHIPKFEHAQPRRIDIKVK
jgi:HSP20 family molecular chaperone IbpA